MKQTYELEIVKDQRPGKGQDPITRKGKIHIHSTSEDYIRALFSKYGWIVTTLNPIQYSYQIQLGKK